MYYVYIIYSEKLNKFYKGSTGNLRARIQEHNQGKNRSTKSGCPWKLVYYEAYSNKTLARKSELFYKTSQGRRQLKKKLGI